MLREITRRHFFQQSGFGIGYAALRSLLDQSRPDGPARAKRVIYLFMAGAPSQIDLFDHKPALRQHDGSAIPEEFLPKGERFAFIKGTPRLLGSPYQFTRHGASQQCLSRARWSNE